MRKGYAYYITYDPDELVAIFSSFADAEEFAAHYEFSEMHEFFNACMNADRQNYTTKEAMECVDFIFGKGGYGYIKEIIIFD